jgi:hypothetical protein
LPLYCLHFSCLHFLITWHLIYDVIFPNKLPFHKHFSYLVLKGTHTRTIFLLLFFGNVHFKLLFLMFSFPVLTHNESWKYF